MKADNKLVDKLAELARLEFDVEHKKEIISDLDNIFAFVEKLNEINTDGVEPLTYIPDEKNIFREDEAKQTLTHEQIMRNVPVKDSDYIKVPKVLKK